MLALPSDCTVAFLLAAEQLAAEDHLSICRRAQKAEAELRKTNSDLTAREHERNAAESRANAAQAECDRGITNSSVLAAVKKVSLPMFT